MSRISPEPYFHTMNGPLVSEHSVEGVPASLYKLTKSVPDPFTRKWPCRAFVVYNIKVLLQILSGP